MRLFLILPILLAVLPADAENYYLHADGSGDFPTIQAAVDAAADYDRILLYDGVYTGVGNRNVDIPGKGITIGSASQDPALCVIDCEGFDRAFYCHGSSGDGLLRFKNLTIMNGYVDPGEDPPWGGAVIAREGAHPYIINCVFSDCDATMGAAIATTGSLVSLEFCLLYANVDSGPESSGGAIYCRGGGASVSNCTLAFNTSGIRTEINASLYCQNNIIAFSTEGSAIADFGSEPHVDCSTHHGNPGVNWDWQWSGDHQFSFDPLLCAPYWENYMVRDYSPCLPEGNECGVLIGAYDAGCGAPSDIPEDHGPSESGTWGEIKVRFR